MTRISIALYGMLLLFAVTLTQGKSLTVNETIGIPPGVYTPYDDPWTVKCDEGASIFHIASHHSNQKEDRQWKFECTRAKVDLGLCYWSGYVNDYEKALDYRCSNGVIAGVETVFDNGKEDRRFSFYCCHVEGPLSNCASSGYVNNFDDPLNFAMPTGSYLQGEYSYHDRHYDDRRWSYTTCKPTSIIARK